MSSSINHKEIIRNKLKRKYEFTVARQYLSDKIEQELISQQKTFSTPGFRRGKVPLNILKMHKEKDVTNAVISQEIQTISQNFFEENKLKPIDSPNITDVNFDNDLKYGILVELQPEVPLVEIEKLDIKKESVSLCKSDLDKYIKSVLKDCFDLIDPPKSHKIQDGDVVYIDFVGKIDNKVFEGGTGKDFMITVGSNMVLAEVEKGLIGCLSEEELTINATFPEDYPMKKLVNKQAEFSIKIKRIKVKKQITDNNEVIKHFNCKTKDEFIEKAKKDLQKKCDFMIEMIAKKDIFNYIEKKFVFDVPETTVNAEAKKISSDAKNKSEIMSQAEKRVRLGFILMKIAEEKSINVTEEDISNALIAKAQGDTKNMQYIIDVYKKNTQASIALKGEILEQKVAKFVVNSLSTNDDITIAELEKKFKKLEG
ncbi:MAG: trigger factor [Rickettsiaceae bacterium H1]|nr:trigger factor [Rickettsiaceae bacterium H1]